MQRRLRRTGAESGSYGTSFADCGLHRCHSAIKVNTALDPRRMEWLLLELAKTEHPTSCPHGRPSLCSLVERDPASLPSHLIRFWNILKGGCFSSQE